ncbi:MAG: EamA family transporter [Acidobacteria bacterium]|nr:EamA family transporter [Acidobacteriota bacterium]
MASTEIIPVKPPANQGLGYGACALAGCLWSTGFYFGKIALGEMSVGHMVLYRFLFATAALLPVLRKPRFSRHEWGLLLVAAFLGVPVQFLVQFYGLSLTTVSQAALMVGTMPVILAIGATIFAHEKLDKLGWIALCGSTAGVGLIVFSGRSADAGPRLTGDLLVVASLVLSLGWILLNKRLMLGNSPLSVTAWGVLLGTAMLTVWVLLVNGAPPVHGISLRAWLALAASGVLCTASTTLLWNWGIHHVPASRAGVFLNIEPAMGSVLGIKLMGDHLGPGTLAGGALILAAAVTLTTSGRAEPEGMLE